ncbi:lipopolysaccharide biosynthesis protein [Stieleria varia]|uniref:Polysaccharide biosynthesis protein n=1 Tax=Stieleria varia TaxID=2528005 RepID=A0A5C6AE39_9BACT|nr:oligosaccharide flippase family protein [Stieleria varia]TWT98312.1 Polysaccharide biosynthesis protein [Stieleria varia]
MARDSFTADSSLLSEQVHPARVSLDPAVENLSELTGPSHQASPSPNGQASIAHTDAGDSAPKVRFQFVATVAVAFAIVLLQMAQGILLARLLGPEGRGAYATAVLYAQMLLYIGLFGGLEVICRYAAEARVDQTQLRRAALWLGMTTGIITTAVVVVLAATMLPAEKRYLIPQAIIVSLSVMGQQVMLIMTAVDRGRGRFGPYNIRRVIAAAAFPVLLLIALPFTQIDVNLACWLFVGASVISMLACLTHLPKPFTGESHPSVPKLLKESRPYAVSMLVTDLFDRMDLFLVTWLVVLQEQGFYAAIVPVVYPLTVIPNTMGLFLFNAGADQERSLTTKDIHRILGSAIAVQTMMTVAFVILVGPVVRLLYGEAFEPAIEFAYWLAPASAIKGILQGLDSYLKGRGRPLSVLGCRIVAIVMMLIVTMLLLDSMGTVAVAVAALAGQVVCLIWFAAIVYADVQPERLS